MPGKILVIGARGKAGSEVVRALRERGEDVLAATRTPESATALQALGATPVAFDYDDQGTWKATLIGVDRVFLAARPGDPAPEATLIPFLDLIREAGVRNVAFLTAFGVDTNEELGLRKAERYLEGLGTDYTFLRPNWFHQNFNRGMFKETIDTMGGVFVPAGEGKVSFIDARDIASVAATVLTEDGHRGQGYALTGPAALSFGEAAAIISKASGKDVKYVSVTESDARGALTKAGLQPPQVEFMLGLFSVIRQGWSAPVTSAVKDVTGRDPISLERFAKDYADDWR